MKTLGEIAYEAASAHPGWVEMAATNECWEAIGKAVRAAVAEEILRMVIRDTSSGANSDDFQTAEWIAESIEKEYGLNLSQRLWDEWWAKNGAENDRRYGRNKPLEAPYNGPLFRTIQKSSNTQR